MSFKIPLFDLNFDEKEELAVLDTIRSKWISMGPKTETFENRFAEMLNIRYAVALTNCTTALHLAMIVAGIKPDDEVICPSLTFVASCNAIRYVNAIPVFADIKSLDDLTIDPTDIERKITKKTKAILVMHYGGFACNMGDIMDIADRYNLKVIEDSCHGPLSEYNNNKLGTIGDVGCFSFFSNKNISTGEGGMLVTNSKDYYEKAKLLRSHGMTSMSYDRSKGHTTSYDVIDFGYNYRMDDIRAAIGLAQLDKIKSDLDKRAYIRDQYNNLLKDMDTLIIPFLRYSEYTSNYIYTILLKQSASIGRDKLRGMLAEAGIQTSVHYPPVHRFSVYREYYSDLPLTDYAAENLITLPMYSKLSVNDINYIVDQLKKYLNNE